MFLITDNAKCMSANRVKKVEFIDSEPQQSSFTFIE